MSQAGWFNTGTILPDIETLTGNAGGAIGPDGAGNVDLVGDGTFINVTGAGNTLTWALGTVDVPHGGTGVTTLTDHGVLVGSGAGAVTALTVGTDGQVLLGSSAADPVFATLTSTGATIAFTPGAGTLNLETGAAIPKSFPTDAGTATPALQALTVAGGTNINTAGAAATVTINLDANLTAISSITAANGGSLRTGTTAADTLLLQAYDNDTGPAYTTFITLTAGNTPACDLDDAVTKAGNYIYRAGGTDVPVADGGTGASSFTAYAVTCGGTAATNPLQSVASVGTSGQVLTSNGAGALPTFQDASGYLSWSVITGASQALATGNGYFANNAGTINFSLPAAAAVGDIFAVYGMNNATGWQITQGAGQTIHFGTSDTTTGAGGSLTSSATYDGVVLVCNVANTDFVVIQSLGNITIV